MSTKIYNGFKFTTTDVFEINKQMDELRKDADEIVKQKTIDFFVETAIHNLDHNTIHPTNKKSEKEAPFMIAFNAFQERQHEAKIRQTRDPSVGFELSIMVLPFENEFYGIYYTQQAELAAMVSKKPFFKPFGYWNNTDPDENCSEEEWKERERVWENLFDDKSIPSLCGFNYQIVLEETYWYPTVNDIVANLPSIDERLTSQAKNELYTKYMEDKTVSGNNVMKSLRGFFDYCKTDEGMERLVQQKKRLEKILKRVVTHEMLMGK